MSFPLAFLCMMAVLCTFALHPVHASDVLPEATKGGNRTHETMGATNKIFTRVTSSLEKSVAESIKTCTSVKAAGEAALMAKKYSESVNASFRTLGKALKRLSLSDAFTAVKQSFSDARKATRSANKALNAVTKAESALLKAKGHQKALEDAVGIGKERMALNAKNRTSVQNATRSEAKDLVVPLNPLTERKLEEVLSKGRQAVEAAEKCVEVARNAQSAAKRDSNNAKEIVERAETVFSFFPGVSDSAVVFFGFHHLFFLLLGTMAVMVL